MRKSAVPASILLALFSRHSWTCVLGMTCNSAWTYFAGAYVEDGWVDESAPASSGPGLFGMLFGGNKKSANASELAKKEALERDLDKIEFVDGTTGSLSFASRAGTAVPFGGLNPVQVEKYEVDGKLVGERGVDGEKAPAVYVACRLVLARVEVSILRQSLT